MSRTIEDSEGNFWEIFDDGVVSRNGEPFGELNEYGEIHPYSGSDMYVIDNYGRIVRYSDRAVMGTYRGDNYFDRSTATGGYGGSSGSYGGSSGGGYGSSSGSYGGYSGSSGGGTGCGLLLLLFFGVVGALANLAAVMAGGVMILAEGVRRTGSLRGGLSLIGSEALRAVREALGDLPFADEAMKAVGIVAAALLAALLLAAGVLTLIAMYRILKKRRQAGLARLCAAAASLRSVRSGLRKGPLVPCGLSAGGGRVLSAVAAVPAGRGLRPIRPVHGRLPLLPAALLLRPRGIGGGISRS